MAKDLQWYTDTLAEFGRNAIQKAFEEEPLKSIFDKYKFEFSCDFIICHEGQYFAHETERLKKWGYKKKEIDKYFLYEIHHNENLSCTEPAKAIARVGKCKRKDNGKEYVFISEVTIYLSTDELARTLLKNLDRTDDVVNSFKLIIRHEIGHMIDYLHLVGLEVSEYWKLVGEDRKVEKEIRDKMKEYSQREGVSGKDKLYVQNMMYYTEIPAEKRANEYAKFTPEELELIYNQYNLN